MKLKCEPLRMQTPRDSIYDDYGDYKTSIPYIAHEHDLWAIREKTLNPVVYAINSLRSLMSDIISIGRKQRNDIREMVIPAGTRYISIDLDTYIHPVRAVLISKGANEHSRSYRIVENIEYDNERKLLDFKIGAGNEEIVALVEFWRNAK